MATQHFKRNLLLNLYIEKKNRWFVSSCLLREIKMSDTCSIFLPLETPGLPACYPLNIIESYFQDRIESRKQSEFVPSTSALSETATSPLSPIASNPSALSYPHPPPGSKLLLCSLICFSFVQSQMSLCDPVDCSSPSPSQGTCSNSLSQWCHPTVSSSVVPFSFSLQCFPESGSFLMSHLFASDVQGPGASVSPSVLPMNIQCWFPLGLICLILLSMELSRVLSDITVWKHQIFFCFIYFY